MATKIQLRHDTATNWASANPILSVGEVGFETDTNKAKFGNGVTEYNELPYICEEIIKKYSELQDKPKINSIELVGDTSLDELNIQVKGDYATREDLTVALEPKANVSDLENYVQNEKLNEYATLVSVAESLELKADKESLGDYVLKEEMGEYVTPTTLAESLELKADKETTYTKEEVDALIPSEVVVPTKVSELENDLGFISAVSEEYITEEELTTTLEPYAKKEEIELPTVPTKVSELENDSGFLTVSDYDSSVIYNKGDMISYQDKMYISVIDNNSNPIEVPIFGDINQGWVSISEGLPFVKTKNLKQQDKDAELALIWNHNGGLSGVNKTNLGCMTSYSDGLDGNQKAPRVNTLTGLMKFPGGIDGYYTSAEVDGKLPATTSLMNGEAPVIADIEATEVADLVTALNAVLAQLRTRGVIA